MMEPFWLLLQRGKIKMPSCNDISSWNLLLGEREDTINNLQEQLSLVQKFDFDNFNKKEELLEQELNEQAGLKAELDALAREETSLNNLLFSITDALSTVQVSARDYLKYFWWDLNNCTTSQL